MDKKIILAFSAVIIIIAFYLFGSGDQVKAPSEKPTDIKTYQSSSPKNDTLAELNINDSFSSQQEHSSISSFNVKQTSSESFSSKYASSSIENTYTESSSYNPKKEYVKIKSYLKTHNYKKISINKDINLYVKNPPAKKQNSFMPPSLPTIVNVKIDNKTVPVIINTNILKTNDEIYVEKDDEIVKVDLKNDEETSQQSSENIKILLPPSIGQN